MPGKRKVKATVTPEAPEYYLWGVRASVPQWQLCWLLNQKYQFELALTYAESEKQPYYHGFDPLTNCELLLYEKLPWPVSAKAALAFSKFTLFMLIVPSGESSLEANYFTQLLYQLPEIEFLHLF